MKAIFRIVISTALCLGAVMAHAGVASSAQTVAGLVAFVSGSVTRQGAQGETALLKIGDPVYVGDRIHTLQQGYVHVRMVDQAFVSLRPNSQLLISAYEYSDQQPQSSRIRFDMVEGRSRVVSGKGGQAAKQNYRFNTPIAAIGLRGTDYTVQVNPDSTRVSVAQGAVLVSPFLEGCAPDTLGPCETTLARELQANIPHAYLEVTATDPQPKLVVPVNGQQSKAGKTLPEAGGATVRDIESDSRAATVLSVAVLESPSIPLYPGALGTPSGRFTSWGRWSTVVAQTPDGSPSVAQAFVPAIHNLITTNDAFVLFERDDTLTRLPSQGQASFGLDAAEAYVVSAGLYTPAKVLQGQLDIDFAQRTFATQVQVNTGASSPEKVNASGGFSRYGQLTANPATSNAQVVGVVVNAGREVAYLFDKPLGNGAQLLGATQWGR